MPVKSVHISGKVSDLCSVSLWDETDHFLEECNGYVPNIPALGGGDYLDLEIDNSTGQIINWKPIECLS